MTEGLYEKAHVLLSQSRYNEAEVLLGQLLAANPDDDHIIYMLGEISYLKEDYERAEELVNSAIGIYPQDAQYFFLKSRIAMARNKYKDAEKYINEAIAINPNNAAFFAFYAIIKIILSDFTKALELADEALSLDPSDIQALNARSTALLKLNRKEESFKTIEGALHEDPDNSYTHANYGWGLLEKGDTKAALHHFTEALRKDPNSGYAQAGMTEALKARFIAYRWFLNFAFWMGNKAAKYQWFIILGFYFGTKFLNSMANRNDNLRPFIMPLVVLLTLFAFSTWVIGPISNVFLRFNRYGRHLLSKEEQVSSVMVSLSLLLCIISILLWLTISEVWLFVAIYGFTMMVPLSRFFETPAAFFKSYAIGMAGLGLMALTLAYTNAFGTLSTIYFFGFIAFQFAANYFATRPRL